MKLSSFSFPVLIALALVSSGCSRSAKDETKADVNSSSAKASAQAATNGTADGTGKVYSKETATNAGGPAPLNNPEASMPKVAGESVPPGTVPGAAAQTPAAPAAKGSPSPSPSPSAKP